MDENQSVSPDILMQDLLSEVVTLRHKLQLAEEKIMQLELALLQSRDFAIGSAAEAGEARADIGKLQVARTETQSKLIAATIHIENHLNHIQRLETALSSLQRACEVNISRSRQLDLVLASATWRIGRIFMLPIRILRRIIG